MVITLLAVVGMNIANTELASATSEQLRLRAFNAAETGLEGDHADAGRRCRHGSHTDRRRSRGRREFAAQYRHGRGGGHLRLVTTYRGEGNMMSRYSAGTFVGFHYSVDITGRSARNAESVHTAGAVLINGVGENNPPPPIDPDDAPSDACREGLGDVSPSG